MDAVEQKRGGNAAGKRGDRDARGHWWGGQEVAAGFKRPAPLRDGEGGSAGVQIAVDKVGASPRGGRRFGAGATGAQGE
jgi:hypothetical protein